MKIVQKILTDIGGSIVQDDSGNYIIKVPPITPDLNTVVRVDISNLKNYPSQSMTAYIEDRTEDSTKLTTLLMEAMTLQAKYSNEITPPDELEKAVIVVRLAEINKEIYALCGINLYDLI